MEEIIDQEKKTKTNSENVFQTYYYCFYDDKQVIELHSPIQRQSKPTINNRWLSILTAPFVIETLVDFIPEQSQTIYIGSL